MEKDKNGMKYLYYTTGSSDKALEKGSQCEMSVSASVALSDNCRS